jgi:hypothetical protein
MHFSSEKQQWQTKETTVEGQQRQRQHSQYLPTEANSFPECEICNSMKNERWRLKSRMQYEQLEELDRLISLHLETFHKVKK